MTSYGLPQRSVLGPLLFLIYIKQFHMLIHYFADNKNILFSNKSLKKQIYSPWLSTDSTMAKSKPYLTQFK